MKLKLNADGFAIVKDGKPVYVKDDGTEVDFDVAGMAKAIADRNAEAKGHREAKEAAEARLKAFEGIDPDKARDALSKLSSIDAKKLVDAGEIDKVRSEIAKSFEPIKQEYAALKSQYNGLLLDNAFKGSSFVKDKLAIPADFARAYFEKHFEVADGKISPKDANGNLIYSPSNPGVPAGFDEALQIMVSSHPSRDSILKAPPASGSGAQQPVNGSGQGNKTATRTQFDAMPQHERAAFSKAGGVVADG